MSHIGWINSKVLDLIPENFNEAKILDVACGYGQWAYLIKIQKNIVPSSILGIEVHKPCIDKIKTLALYDNIMKVDVREKLPFKDKTFDLCLACEILEHVNKQDGLNLMAELERVCRKRIIVSTPQRFIEQFDPKNPYGAHISLWKIKDFNDLGYNAEIAYPLPRILYAVDTLRRLIFGLDLPFKEIIAYKDMDVNESKISRLTSRTLSKLSLQTALVSC